MANRPLLHGDIFDSNNPQLNLRAFQKGKAKDNVVYAQRFSEAFPTMWACAYELDKLVQTYGAASNIADLPPEHHEAVEEWVCMLTLYYSGVINPETFDQRVFQDQGANKSEYDPDLWPALSGTYPGRAANALTSMTLLRVDDSERTVVGAYYPNLVFFPSRGRSMWRVSPELRKYLKDNSENLSWLRCSAELMKEDEDRAGLADYLASVGATLGGVYDDAIRRFCATRRLNLPVNNVSRFNSSNPFAANSGWRRVIEEDADKIMAAYPLVRVVKSNGITKRTYYLVQGLNSPATWMTEALGKGMPTPQLIKKLSNDEITISWAGKDIPYKLKRTANGYSEDEDIVLLKDLFLDRPAYWCKPPAANAEQGPFVARIETCHKQDVKSRVNQSDLLRTLCDETALILAPINAEFIEHFGYIDEQDYYGTDPARPTRKLVNVECRTTDLTNDGVTKEGARWSFTVTGLNNQELQIIWVEAIEQSPKLPNKSVAIWPPRVSPDWRLYAIRCVGEKKKESGAWALIDENGMYGRPESRSDSENLSILQDSEKPNRPVALMLYDAVDQPRGVFFLKLQANSDHPDRAYLGVDFGTSNTCLAYGKEHDATTHTLIFSLKPEWLWGPPWQDNAGFVPYEWHGKSFYSTVLLAPKNNTALANKSGAEITATDLFQVDIPVLHKGLADTLYNGSLETNWNAYPDLKWDIGNENGAWRAFFLSLSLLYAYAELLFNKKMKVAKCIWTYPLAFSGGKDEMFRLEADAVRHNVQELCYGKAGINDSETVSDIINESEAIAIAEGVEEEGKNYVDIFIDIGGGSTDVAVYGDDQFWVQDSVEVAGKAFFSFAEESVDPNHQFTRFETKGAMNFRENINKLLRGSQNPFTMPSGPPAEGQAFTAEMYKLGTFYSITIGNLPVTAPNNKHSIKRGEMLVIEKDSIKQGSYQTYRSQWFYRHLISYALLQACAAVLNNDNLEPNFRLICSGNGWGLALFAGMKKAGTPITKVIREEAANLLGEIKASLLKNPEMNDTEEGKEVAPDIKKKRQRIEALTVNKVKFLDGESAKIAVAYGAVKSRLVKRAASKGSNKAANDGEETKKRMVCYTGIKLGAVKLNGQAINVEWDDQWSDEQLLRNVADKKHGIKTIEFEKLDDDTKPCDSLLEVFVTSTDSWGNLNSVIRKRGAYEDNRKLAKSPINQLLARVLYPNGNRHFFLENMAKQDMCNE